MKNFGILLFVLTTVFVVSCQKETVDPQRSTVSIESFHQLAKHYHSLNFSTDYLKKPTKKEIKKIIKADVAGAGIGVKMGSVFGPWGMLVGGLIVGGLASWAESGICCDESKDFLWVFENNYTPAIAYIPNPTNPFDEVGVLHNQVLVNLAEGLSTGQIEDPDNFYLLYKHLIPSIKSNYPDAIDLISDPAFVEMLNTSNDVILEDVLSENAYEIYDIYISAAMEIDYLEDYINFTIDYENLLLEVDMDEDEKNAILAALAVSRYSNTYWTNVLEI